MEPLRGGKLTERIPEKIQKIWDSAPVKRTPAEWALRWVWDQREVSTALSGMSTVAQLIENIRIAEDAEAGALSESELQIITQVREAYSEMLEVLCTRCAYCMPCPNGRQHSIEFFPL